VKKELQGVPFSEFVDTSYRLYLLRTPQTVAALGLSDEFGVRNDRLDDYSLSYEQETVSINRLILERLRGFSRDALPDEERVVFDVCEWMWSGGAARAALPASGYVLFPGERSPDVRLAEFFARDLPLDSREGVDDYIACLRQVPRQMGQLRDRIEDQMKRGILLPESALGLTLLQVDALRAASVSQTSEWLPPRNVGTNHPLFIPLRDALPRIAAFSRDDRIRMTQSVGKYVASDVMPALELLYQSVAQRMTAPSRSGIEWSEAAEGRRAYAEIVRETTGTSLSPAEIHRRAQAEMDLLRPAIAELASRLGVRSSATLPEISAATALRAESEAKSFEFLGRPEENLMARACQTLFVTCRVTPGGVGGEAGGLLFAEIVPWSCGVPDPFAGFLEGFQLYALGVATEAVQTELPALALKVRLDLYAAAAFAALDTGIHDLGWSQETAQRELAAMLEATSGATAARVLRSGKRATVVEEEVSDNVMFADVARVAGDPGSAVAVFAVWSEIIRLCDESQATAGASWSESVFHDALIGRGATPFVIAETLVRTAFRR